MTDIFTSEKRSQIMARIRGTNTKPELKLKRLLDGRIFKYGLISLAGPISAINIPAASCGVFIT